MIVNLGALKGDGKRKAWLAVQRDCPELATFMRSPIFAAMRDQLGCSVIVRVEHGRIIPGRAKN